MHTLFLSALMAHLVADWILQNEWQAKHKVSLKHPAAYVHSGIHLLCLLAVLPPLWALLVAVLHLLIDTRKPLEWWRKLIGQTRDAANPAFIPFAMWQDQVLHVLVLWLAAFCITGGK